MTCIILETGPDGPPGQKSGSAAPPSVTAVVEHALPARSVAVADGVQLIVALPATVLTVPLASRARS